MYLHRFVGVVVLEILALCFVNGNQLLQRYDENSIFYEKNSRCEKIVSGLNLTELTCVTMVRLPVFGYVKHNTDEDKVSSCWRCGRDIVSGAPDNFTEKQVWATAMPAQYLSMDTTVGNVIIGERINATMPSGASVVMDADHGRVLSLNGIDSCVSANPIQDFNSISVTLHFRKSKGLNNSKEKLLYHASLFQGKRFVLRCQVEKPAVSIHCVIKHDSAGWHVTIHKNSADVLDQWVHLGVTWGYEEGMVVYVNGIKTGECARPYSSKSPPVKEMLLFGCSKVENYLNFVGLIDEVLMWNDILSSEFMKAYFG